MTSRFMLKATRGLAVLLALALMLLTASISVVAAPVRVEAVEVELVAPTRELRAGQWEWIGLRIRHDPHWHTYWRNPGDSGLPTRLTIDAPAGIEVDALQWPRPERFLIAPLASYGYEGNIVLPLRVRVPQSLAGQSIALSGAASWLMCRDVCIPGDATLKLSVPILSGDSSPSRSAHAEAFERALALLPREAVDLAVGFGESELSIALPASRLSASPNLPHVEFFPYSEQGLRHAAVQRLVALPAGSEWPARVVIELNEDGRRLINDRGFARADLARGMLMIGDQVIEVLPTLSATPFAAGPELARVEAKPVVMPPGASSPTASRGGVLGAFLPGPGARSASALPAPNDGGSLWLALGFAVLGGVILNLMPCVFPVIGLKVLAFASHAPIPTGARSQALAVSAREAASSTRATALAFAGGVLASFLALGALMLGLKSAGLAAGWGFQLQSPIFVSAMALLFVAIGLNLAGLFEIGLGLTQLARFDIGPQAKQDGAWRWASNVGSGALAVLVATPCTAPFMASALGFTLAASAAEALAVFIAIGLGMAAPYLLLGWFPGWLKWLPKPGRWMESLRQALAFPMFITAAWLAWVLGQQAGIDAVFALAVGAVLIGLGAWCLGRFVQPRGLARAKLAGVLAILALGGGVWLALTTADQSGMMLQRSMPAASLPQPMGLLPPGAPPETALSQGNPAVAGAVATAPNAAAWQVWSRDRVDQALASGQPVFVDFTAAWCVSCQANKKLVLDRDVIVQAMAERSVLRLRADWTQRDAAITAELARYGRSGVPLYLLFDPSSKAPRILPELLTVGMVSDAMAAIPKRR